MELILFEFGITLTRVCKLEERDAQCRKYPQIYVCTYMYYCTRGGTNLFR